jgi:hypothetical protein
LQRAEINLPLCLASGAHDFEPGETAIDRLLNGRRGVDRPAVAPHLLVPALAGEVIGLADQGFSDTPLLLGLLGEDITIAGFNTDARFAELQATQALADRQDKRTSWIRPAYAAPTWFYWFCVVLQGTMPAVAKFIGIQLTPLPFPFDYLAFGIPLAIFGLRPVEKYTKANTVTKAQATIAAAK